jgi:hypothetical protein
MNNEYITASKYAGVSLIASIGSIPLDDTTQIGQIISILIGIVSGITSLYKLLKKKK